MHACMLLQLFLTLRPSDLWPARFLYPWDSPGKNTGVSCWALLQGMFPTQGLNPGLLHLLYWQTCSLPLAPPDNAHKQNLENWYR